MEPLARHRVTVANCPAGEAPLTWAQLGELAEWTASDPVEYAQSSVRAEGSLAGAPDVPRVLAAISAVLARHDALRTRLRRDAQGHWTQVVAASGEFEVAEFAAPDASVAHVRRVMDLLVGSAVDPDKSPVRIAIVTVDGVPSALAVVLWHMIADGIGGAIVCREIRQLSRAPWTELPTPWQPGDIARFERGPDGQRQAQRADRYLRDQLRMVAAPAPPGRGGRVDDSGRDDGGGNDLAYHCGILDSPATAAAAHLLARRHGVSPATAVLTGYLLTLGAWLGRTSISITLGCANRHDPRLRDSIANLAQFVPVRLDLAGGTFAAVCHAVAAAALRAYRYGHHEPARHDRTLREIERERGSPVRLPYAVNLRAIGQTSFDEELPDDARDRLDGYSRLTTGELRSLAGQAEARDFHGPLRRPLDAISFSLWVLTDVATMMVHTDSRTMASEDPGRLLRTVESTMIDAVDEPGARPGG